MSCLVSNIQWDTDGLDPEELQLPTELIVDMVAEGLRASSELSDWLSDKFGWAVRSFDCLPIPSDLQNSATQTA